MNWKNINVKEGKLELQTKQFQTRDFAPSNILYDSVVKKVYVTLYTNNTNNYYMYCYPVDSPPEIDFYSDKIPYLTLSYNYKVFMKGKKIIVAQNNYQNQIEILAKGKAKFSPFSWEGYYMDAYSICDVSLIDNSKVSMII